MQSVARALASTLDVALDVTHEILLLGSDVLHFAPVPGLEEAARTLLSIWDSLQLVEVRFSPPFLSMCRCRCGTLMDDVFLFFLDQ